MRQAGTFMCVVGIAVAITYPFDAFLGLLALLCRGIAIYFVSHSRVNYRSSIFHYE